MHVCWVHDAALRSAVSTELGWALDSGEPHFLRVVMGTSKAIYIHILCQL